LEAVVRRIEHAPSHVAFCCVRQGQAVGKILILADNELLNCTSIT